MSSDLHDGYTPDWDSMDLDWLNDTAEKKPGSPGPGDISEKQAKEPVWDECVSRRRDSAREELPQRRRPSGGSPDQPAHRRGLTGEEAPQHRRESPRQEVPPRRREPSRQEHPTRVVQPEGRPAYQNRKPANRRGKPNVPIVILVVVLVCGMLFAGWQLGSIFLNYRRDRSAYDELAQNAISGLAETEDDAAATPEPGTDKEAVVASEVPFEVDWEYLTSINPDIVGWLYCPNTVVNYPVVQGSDNEYYLNHGFDGNANTSGGLFVDVNSVSGVTQSNFIIYGHNMKDDSMFGSYQSYANESYYEEHPTMYYLTPTGNYRIDLICCHIVEATEDNYPGYFSTTSDYQAYLNSITSNAYWVNYDAVNTNYQLMTMSTCTSASGFSDPRLLVQGMMVPIQ